MGAGLVLRGELHAREAGLDSVRSTIWLRDVSFAGRVDFRGTRFMADADFGGTAFADSVIFEDAKFSAGAQFKGARFETGANFSYCGFSWADFRQAVFVGEADFYASRGAHPLIFESTHFLRRANFDNIESSGWANILNAVGWILITVFVISLGRTWIR